MTEPSGGNRAATAAAQQTEVAVLAGGCFWGVEEILRDVPGILDTEVGYTGGWLESPTYHDTHDSKSGHAEAVRVTFDSAIFPQSPEQEAAAERVRARVAASAKWNRPITTSIEPAGTWYSAEAYHQDYLRKNPGSYSCHYLRD